MENNENIANNKNTASQEPNPNLKKNQNEAQSDYIENKRGDDPNIELLMDITLPISVELGRAKMSIKDILYLTSGSIIELNKFAGEPLDILVNHKPIAKGEVVVIDENFGVRITETVTTVEKAKTIEQKIKK